MGDTLKNLNNYKKVRDINLTKRDLIQFEEHIVSLWENGKIKAPVHLSHGNEDELIEVFSRIDTNDYVFSTWRSHYHALLHGLNGIRNVAGNKIAECIGGRKDYKTDCLAAEFKDWEISWEDEV